MTNNIEERKSCVILRRDKMRSLIWDLIYRGFTTNVITIRRSGGTPSWHNFRLNALFTFFRVRTCSSYNCKVGCFYIRTVCSLTRAKFLEYAAARLNVPDYTPLKDFLRNRAPVVAATARVERIGGEGCERKKKEKK